jgi:hypothetical protein
VHEFQAGNASGGSQVSNNNKITTNEAKVGAIWPLQKQLYGGVSHSLWNEFRLCKLIGSYCYRKHAQLIKSALILGPIYLEEAAMIFVGGQTFNMSIAKWI